MRVRIPESLHIAHMCSAQYARLSHATAVQLCMGNTHFESINYGKESAGTYYDIPTTLGTTGGYIGTSPRLCGDASAHSAVTPGAQYNHEAFLRATAADTPAFTMPRSQREQASNASLASPGPPAYLIKRDVAHYRFGQPARFSIAANLRTDWAATAPGNDSPGPGAHGGHTTFSEPDASSRAPPMLQACPIVMRGA